MGFHVFFWKVNWEYPWKTKKSPSTSSRLAVRSLQMNCSGFHIELSRQRRKQRPLVIDSSVEHSVNKANI